MPTPGPLELVIILVIALLVLGPGKLPEVGASLGKSIREFRKASSDVQESVSVDTTPQPPAAPLAATPAAPVAAPVQAPAPVADAAPAEPSDPSDTASARASNAADSPITAG
jgi:TatA/E family protein of Tat protein translocase